MAKEFQQSQRNKNAYNALAPEAAEISNVPPQAIEIEEAVLGALMLESDSITRPKTRSTPRNIDSSIVP